MRSDIDFGDGVGLHWRCGGGRGGCMCIEGVGVAGSCGCGWMRSAGRWNPACETQTAGVWGLFTPYRTAVTSYSPDIFVTTLSLPATYLLAH